MDLPYGQACLARLYRTRWSTILLIDAGWTRHFDRLKVEFVQVLERSSEHFLAAATMYSVLRTSRSMPLIR